MELIRRFLNTPPQNLLLLGPRGTGKSTWLRDQLPAAIYLDLECPSLRRDLVARPESVRELLADSPGSKTVVIDEIQLVPKLLSVVQTMLDEPSSPRFVLTGSSARPFEPDDSEAWGDSLVYRTLHPFMAAELGDFDLARALRFGMLPMAATASDPRGVLDTYAQLCIDEVMASGLTRHIGRFSRFLRAVTSTHGKRLNVAEVARGCAVERKVIAGYIGILEDLLLAFRLPVFHKRPAAPRPRIYGRRRRATVARDKLFLFDAGFFRALLPDDRSGHHPGIDDQALPGLVAQHIRAWAAYSSGHADLYYWRTRAGTEVDIVVHGSGGTQGFKIGNSHTVQLHDLRALRAFGRDHPEAEAAILYRGRQRTRIDGIWCLPAGEFLRRMRPDQGLLDWL